MKLPSGGVRIAYDVGDYLTLESLNRAYKFLMQRKKSTFNASQVAVWHNGRVKLIITDTKDIGFPT